MRRRRWSEIRWRKSGGRLVKAGRRRHFTGEFYEPQEVVGGVDKKRNGRRWQGGQLWPRVFEGGTGIRRLEEGGSHS